MKLFDDMIFVTLVRLPSCLMNWLRIEFERHTCIQQAGKEDSHGSDRPWIQNYIGESRLELFVPLVVLLLGSQSVVHVHVTILVSMASIAVGLLSLLRHTGFFIDHLP